MSPPLAIRPPEITCVCTVRSSTAPPRDQRFLVLDLSLKRPDFHRPGSTPGECGNHRATEGVTLPIEQDGFMPPDTFSYGRVLRDEISRQGARIEPRIAGRVVGGVERDLQSAGDIDGLGDWETQKCSNSNNAGTRISSPFT